MRNEYENELEDAISMALYFLNNNRPDEAMKLLREKHEQINEWYEENLRE